MLSDQIKKEGAGIRPIETKIEQEIPVEAVESQAGLREQPRLERNPDGSLRDADEAQLQAVREVVAPEAEVVAEKSPQDQPEPKAISARALEGMLNHAHFYTKPGEESIAQKLQDDVNRLSHEET